MSLAPSIRFADLSEPKGEPKADGDDDQKDDQADYDKDLFLEKETKQNEDTTNVQCITNNI